MDSTHIVVMGHNSFGEFGLNHTDAVEELHCIENQLHIKRIHCGYQFTIYCDNNNIYYVCGSNSNGECGINSTDQKVLQLTKLPLSSPLNPFHIKRVYTDTRGSAVFWLMNDNKLYANGSNYFHKLGSAITNKDHYREPHLVFSLAPNEHVVDIRTAFGYTLMLCHHHVQSNLLIDSWLRRNNYNDIIPELLVLIQMFYGIWSTIYATIKSGDGGNGLGTNSAQIWSTAREHDIFWKRIKTLENAQIVKIRVGSAHSLFLDIWGNVYSCGWNRFGQNGLSHCRNESVPTLITYFVENKIKIKDIACGSRHNLAIDTQNRVYSWGNNSSQQCDPHRNMPQFVVPTLIPVFKDYNIKRIECGAWHSCVVTADDEYFLFGSVMFNMCAVSNEDNNGLSLLNHKICKLMNNEQAHIVDITLGWNNTHIMVKSETVKQTKDQIECEHKLNAETIMGYEASDRVLFNEVEEQRDNMEIHQKGVTLMGSVTETNEEDVITDIHVGETLLGHTTNTESQQ